VCAQWGAHAVTGRESWSADDHAMWPGLVQ